VRAFEREVGEGVVERLAVELHDVGAATLAIGMAMIAVLPRGAGLASVQPFSSLAIRRDLFVAGEAEPRLRLAGKSLMALGAVLLQLGVPRDQRSRHDQTFKQRLRAHGRAQCGGGADRAHQRPDEAAQHGRARDQ
jgi:hypothetical protein